MGAKIDRLRRSSQKYPLKKEKAPEKYLRRFSILVPRDRIELPTRGFSDQILENSNILKLQA
ncbi:MAG: hypothetical protein PVF26_14190, partial [Desulfobacterales bacterium]